ncbi:MAG: hypothetical protein ACI9JZ_002766, partial [Lentimonas sp.]
TPRLSHWTKERSETITRHQTLIDECTNIIKR